MPVSKHRKKKRAVAPPTNRRPADAPVARAKDDGRPKIGWKTVVLTVPATMSFLCLLFGFLPPEAQELLDAVHLAVTKWNLWTGYAFEFLDDIVPFELHASAGERNGIIFFGLTYVPATIAYFRKTRRESRGKFWDKIARDWSSIHYVSWKVISWLLIGVFSEGDLFRVMPYAFGGGSVGSIIVSVVVVVAMLHGILFIYVYNRIHLFVLLCGAAALLTLEAARLLPGIPDALETWIAQAEAEAVRRGIEY